jgi:hypothetical protein|tara:strand:+ start:37 stop:279 length:243 start_codon:yes stop_codon:yes gene_type:complete
MENSNSMLTFEASFYAESDKSVAVLVVKGDINGETWSTLEWFPKSTCKFSDKAEFGKLEVTAPVWLLEFKKIEGKITIVK